MSENLPSNPLARFADEAQQYRRPQSGTAGGYLKFNGKTGQWMFGTEETAVDGCEVLVNANKIQHGYIRWGELPPEKAFTPDWTPYPDRPESIEGTDMDGKPKTFKAEEARQFEGAFTGEDDDLGQFIFNSSSMAGVENTDKLYDKMYAQAREHPEYVYPLVRLENEFYKRSTGKVFKPVFTVVAWCDVNGKPMTEADKKLEEPAPEKEAPEKEDETPPTRRRRRRTA